MKTIGLLGGMSWESTQTYYRMLNEQVKARLGGLHSAKIVLYSVDFEEIEALQRSGDWDHAGEILASAALAVERAGAEFLVIGTNTMHKVAPRIEQAIRIPLLHIADATADALRQDGIQRVGLLGTRFTMEQAFYRERLEAAGIQVVIPGEDERALVHRVIFEELCLGEINPASRQSFLDVLGGLAEQGAEAVILGCTEIGLLIQQVHTPIRLYDTTAIHAARAVEVALAAD